MSENPAPADLPFLNFTPEELALLPRDDLGPTLLVSIWGLQVLCSLVLALRLYCKVARSRGMWWDDYVLILSWVRLLPHTPQTVDTLSDKVLQLCLLIANITSTITVPLGYGKHIYDIEFETFLKLPLYANIGGTFSILAAVWSKTSFAITLLRISHGWMWAVVWCIIVTMNMAMGLSALFIWIQCTPIEKSWNFLLPGTCYPLDLIIDYLTFSAGEL